MFVSKDAEASGKLGIFHNEKFRYLYSCRSSSNVRKWNLRGCSLKQRLSWEADIISTGQEIPRL